MKRRIVSALVVAAVCAAFVPAPASASVGEKAKKVSTSKYAKVLC